MLENKWNRHIDVAFDPLIKQADSDLFGELESYFEQLNFNKKDFEQFQSHDSFQKIVIFSSKRFELNSDIFESTDSIYLEYQENNMSLFSQEKKTIDLNLHLKFTNFHEFHNLISIVNLYLENKVQTNIKEIYQIAEKNLKKMTSTSKLKEIEIKPALNNLLEEFEQDLFNCNSLETIKEKLEFQSKKIKQKIQLLTTDEVYLVNDLIIPVNFKDNLYYIAFEKDRLNMDLVPFLFQSIYHALKRLSIKEVKVDILGDLEEIFSAIEIPIAIFDNDLDLILHNNKFIKLNLSAKKCFSLIENDQISIDKDVYKIKRTQIEDKNYEIFYFIPVKEVLGASSKPTSEELGIVSSSIAHELNNPLAGILAAVTVLEMDDYPDDVLEKFHQMKDSVSRCKKLVETFLGFSKVQDTQSHSYFSLEEGFNQAMDLIRFRLIENNISLNFEYEVSEKFSHHLNKHVMAMIFYLFLGECLTSFSHQNLVENKSSLKIQLKVDEKKDSIYLNLPDKMNLDESFIKSKLISHLLKNQKLTLVFLKSTLWI